jgi:hypothetical protein
MHYNNSRQFHLFQLWFLIPGLFLIGSCIYFPLSYLYRHIFWTRTEASVLGREWDRDGNLLVDMTYVDARGEVHPIRVDSETYSGDPDNVPVYYDPERPGEFQVVNHFRYFMVIFIPFGLFLTYLGWPHKTDLSQGVKPVRRTTL